MLKKGIIFAISIPFVSIIYSPSLYTIAAFIYISVTLTPFYLIKNSRSIYVHNNYSTYILGLINFTLAAMYGYTVMQQLGLTAYNFLDIDGIYETAIKASSARYIELGDESGNGSPLILSGLLFLSYLIGNNTSKSLLKIFIALLPFILIAIITTTKFPLLMGIVFYLLGWLTAGNKLQFNLTEKIILILIFIILILILYVSLYNRGYEEQIIPILVNYIFTQYTNFGHWILDSNELHKYGLGSYTFIGPLSYLGILERPSGIFDNGLGQNGLESNIFTAWRFLVEDFGYFGPILINILIVYIFLLLKFYRYNKFLLIIQSFLFISLSISFTTNIFTYNSIFIAFIYISLYLLKP